MSGKETRVLDGGIAQAVYAEGKLLGSTPRLPTVIDTGNEWFPNREIIRYRRSMIYATMPIFENVWLAEITNPYRHEEGQYPVIAAWALTPYLAYMRLRERLKILNNRQGVQLSAMPSGTWRTPPPQGGGSSTPLPQGVPPCESP